MVDNFCILVSSCDKFSDLWESHFNLFFKYWIGEIPKVYLVTDKKTSWDHKNVDVLVFDGDMPKRLLQACKSISSQYVLITLDDYFLISETYEERISFLVECAKSNKIDYLRIYDRRYAKKKYHRPLEEIVAIDLGQKYALSLYPAIWNKEFFIKCVDEDLSPWSFEPGLTKKAIQYNANCYYNNSGSFEILDVVRKGKVLHKANSYLKKHNIDIGNRELIQWKYEIKQSVADFIWWYMPKWVYYLSRKLAEKIGFTFYSDL